MSIDPAGTLQTARFAAILGTLHAAHNLADHLVQTDAQALGKTRPSGWLRPMAGHVGGYHATQLAALLTADRILDLGLSRWRTAVAVAFSAGTHAVLDRRWPVHRILELSGSPGFAAPKVAVDINVDGLGRIVDGRWLTRGVPGTITATGPVPLHGPYLADQALHHTCLWITALIASGRTR